MTTIYLLAYELTILLGLSLLLGVWQMPSKTRGRLGFVGAVGAGIAWCLADALLLRGVIDELTSDRLKYIGALALPPLWLGFAAHVTRLPIARRVPQFPLLLLVPGAFLYAMMWSGRYGSLFLTTVPGGEDVHGPLWLVGTFYGQLLTLAACVILVFARDGDDAKRRRRRVLAGLAPLLPLLGNAAYLTWGSGWPIDPTPLLMTACLFALRSAVFAGALLQPLPVSQLELVHQLPIAVLLADHNGEVVEINDAASSRLGLPEPEALGLNLGEIAAESSAAGATLRSVELTDRGRPCGRLVLVE